MTTIYLIRAAESEAELYHIAQGHYDSNLTSCGWRQVKALQKRFADIHIDGVYTSDLYRGCATASAIYKPKNLAVCRRKDLREICLGNWEGQPWGNIAYRESEQIEHFKTQPEKWRVEGAEAPRQVLQRMQSAIRQIADQNIGKAVAVVSHGYAIRLLLAELQGIQWQKAHELPMPQHTAIAVIEANDDKLQLAAQNDASHLGDEFYPAYQQPDFNTDLYFHPLPRIEYGEIFADAVKCVWQESGEDQPFDKNILLNNLYNRTTFVGFLQYDPAGFLQLGPQPGWIALLCTHPGCRKAGLGVQLIGQAALAARAFDLEHLRIALPSNNPHRAFFTENGFTPIGETQEGREVLQKYIGFDAEFLNYGE